MHSGVLTRPALRGMRSAALGAQPARPALLSAHQHLSGVGAARPFPPRHVAAYATGKQDGEKSWVEIASEAAGVAK
jgi:hypothetical protein